jgi:hypothetical protein
VLFLTDLVDDEVQTAEASDGLARDQICSLTSSIFLRVLATWRVIYLGFVVHVCINQWATHELSIHLGSNRTGQVGIAKP